MLSRVRLRINMFNGNIGVSNEPADDPGFVEYPDGLLDHLTEADQRAELDVFDEGGKMHNKSI